MDYDKLTEEDREEIKRHVEETFNEGVEIQQLSVSDEVTFSNTIFKDGAWFPREISEIETTVDDKDEYIRELKAELEEANDNATWWRSRYKAAVRMANGSNWNKLKEWLEAGISDPFSTWGETYPKYTYENVLEQMKEIEGDLRDEQ